MEQKSYKYEILNLLLKEKNHIRKLAKKLGINHMTILRKMNSLFKDNIVDYKIQGKNKVYFIKKTSEARQYVFMTEQYKLLMLLEKYPELRWIIDNIQNNKKVRLVVIFGSYAKLIAKKNSDIDVYVETIDRKLKKVLESIDSKLSIKIGKYNKKNLLIKEIEKNHVIIKGVEKYYEKSEFFE